MLVLGVGVLVVGIPHLAFAIDNLRHSTVREGWFAHHPGLFRSISGTTLDRYERQSPSATRVTLWLHLIVGAGLSIAGVIVLAANIG